MSSSSEVLIVKNIQIDIPGEHIENGKSLLIEKYSELFIDGYHLSRPAKFIRQIHGLCLLDIEEQDLTKINSTHQSEVILDENQLVQIELLIPSQCLNDGKIIIIEKNSLNTYKQISGNLEDLYHVNPSIIHIRLDKEILQRGQRIIIEKDNIRIENDVEFQQLKNNQITERDQLIRKNLMKISIELPPDSILHEQMITLRKEDVQSVTEHFPFHHSNEKVIIVNENHPISLEEFLSNEIWNPILLDNEHLFQFQLYFSHRNDIKDGKDVRIVINDQHLCVQLKEDQEYHIYQQITLPERAKLDLAKATFNSEDRSLSIRFPFH